MGERPLSLRHLMESPLLPAPPKKHRAEPEELALPQPALEGCCRPGKRHVLAAIACVGFIADYTLRVAMSVGAEKPANGSTSITAFTDLHWSNMQQGWVLGSFYVGYTLGQVPGSLVAARYGAKLTLGLGIALASVFSMLTPLGSTFWVMCVIRALTGVAEAAVYPAAAQLLSHWVPPQERASLATIIFSGSYVGTVLALPLSAMLLERLGWRSIFYVWGGCGLAWTVVWFAVVEETPAVHRSISSAERRYIEAHLQEERRQGGVPGNRPLKHMAAADGVQERDTAAAVVVDVVVGGAPSQVGGGNDGGGGGKSDQCGVETTSWCLLFSHTNVWAMIGVSVTFGYCFYVFLSDLPSYLSTVLGYSVEQAGRVALLPYIAIACMCPLLGVLSDWLVRARAWRPLYVRKLMNSIGNLVPGICMGLLHCVPHNDVAVILLMVIAVGAGGAAMSGASVHCLDIGGKHTGLIFAVMNTAAQIPGIVAPVITSYFVERYGDEHGYSIVFWICCGSYAIGAVWFGALANSSVVHCTVVRGR